MSPGRRVHLGAVVLMASIFARVLRTATQIRHVTGVPARTTQRWLGWWSGPFVSTEVFLAVRARLVGIAVEALPASTLEQLTGSPVEKVTAALAS